VAAFLACGAFSFVGWPLLALPARLPSSLLEGVVPYGCPYETRTVGMYLCSAKIALVSLIGPILITILVIVFRKRLGDLVRRVSPRLPANGQFLIPPLVATLAFTLAWAGSHYDIGGERGIVTQRVFPGFIGLFTFAVAQWGASLQRHLGAFFDFRDRFPVWQRVALLMLVPVVISLAITFEDRVTRPVLKEQVVVLLSVVAGYLALAPRAGGLAGIADALRR